MPLSPGGTDDNPYGSDDNEGPHCRNCHSGASSCNQCHGVNDVTGAANGAFGTVVLTEGKSTFLPNSYLHTSAVAGLSGQCIDGGFSFPHRTLGTNMLKDELYGIDFDGTAVSAGETRTVPAAFTAAGWSTDNYAYGWYQSWESENTTDAVRADGIVISDLSWTESGVQIGDGIVAENLDSVCIDCHGDGTYWNGDDPSFYDPVREGWDLLLKGLP